MNPDAIFIGESNAEAGAMLQGIHQRLTDNEPSIHRMNIYNAELAKISVNAFCTKITFANTIAEICEHMPEGDADIVTKGLRGRLSNRKEIYYGRTKLWGPLLSKGQQSSCSCRE